MLVLHQQREKAFQSAKPAAYAIGILKHVIADYHRRREKTADRMISWEEFAEAEASVLPPVDGGLDRTETRERMEKLAARLNAPERRLLEWKREGLTMKEIAQQFGMPEGTVRSTLTRLKQKMRAMLEEQ